MIYVVNKKCSQDKLKKDYLGAEIIDVTSNSSSKFQQLSPFYPHGGLPVPNSTQQAWCVEGIWQGLKVFEHQDIDISCFTNDTMKNLKRTVRKYGAPLGHRYGLDFNSPLLPYFEARMKIYLPSYQFVLEQVPTVRPLLEQINDYAAHQGVILLDYNTNIYVQDLSRPLSHAGLIKLYLEGRYPDLNKTPDLKPFSAEEIDNAKCEYEQLGKQFKKWCKEHNAPQELKTMSNQGSLLDNLPVK